jgi:amidase
MRSVLQAALLAALTAPLSPGQGGNPFEVVEATIDRVHAAFKSGQLTARQLVQAYLDRIRAYDQQGPKLNAIITLNPQALEDASFGYTVQKLGVCGIFTRHSGAD